MIENDHFPNEDQCGYFDEYGDWWRIEPCEEGYECDEDDCPRPAVYEASSHPNEEDHGWVWLCREHMNQRSGLELDDP